mgnify:CR=1 FL=1
MAIPADLAITMPGTPSALRAAGSGTSESIREAAEEFESVFLTTMLQQMFAGLETDGPFGGGQGEEMFRSLLIEEYGSSISKAGGIGIADDIARELVSIQEANQ